MNTVQNSASAVMAGSSTRKAIATPSTSPMRGRCAPLKIKKENHGKPDKNFQRRTLRKGN